MKKQRPAPNEYVSAFERYISRVPETDVLPALEKQPAEIRTALSAVTGERERFRYAPGKWSIREVVGHVIDTERVLGYRAVCIARGETAPLPGYDENTYAANAGHDRRPLASLLAEYEALRRSHVLMLGDLDDAAWLRVGTANGHPVSVRALAFVLVGHVRHHLAVLAEHYGVAAS